MSAAPFEAWARCVCAGICVGSSVTCSRPPVSPTQLLDPAWIGRGATCGRAREDGASLGTRRRRTARRAPGVEEARTSGTTPEAEQLGVVQSFGERGHGRACSGRRMVVGCCDLGYAENQGGGRRLVGGRWIGMDGGWLSEEAEEETRWDGGGGRNGWMGQLVARVRLFK